jgi:hypothetical protein
MLGPSQGDVDSLLILKEPNIPLLVASDSREHHDIFFSSLPAIDRSDVFSQVQLIQILIKVLLESLTLSIVGRNETKLIRIDFQLSGEEPNDFADDLNLS